MSCDNRQALLKQFASMDKAELMQMAMEPKERGVTVSQKKIQLFVPRTLSPYFSKDERMKYIILVPSYYTDQQIEDLYRDYYNSDYFDIQRVTPMPTSTPTPTNVFNLGKKDWRTELIGARKC